MSDPIFIAVDTFLVTGEKLFSKNKGTFEKNRVCNNLGYAFRGKAIENKYNYSEFIKKGGFQ